ncbi:phage tail protein I [Vibrio mangrovi]|uniref:Phage tail protein (Tail_P2_I) n=1 Tax=Vibrio mangrovi TaxID=474394 RepID=A0A1Y6ITN1_9VIBR|nr:phage tail protein I [Vibrio mangrovi]MDW6004724.1 phage tail protein I [Vibrio mangrovi]SMS01015.1 Phage tail protein (Tail_P2_I) [Vibrio mangrovi]
MTFHSQLPPSAGDLERILEQIFWEELQQIERDIRNFLNPRKCRADLLPYLAWELSVDDWDDDWDDSIKRDLCEKALTVHMYKGTRGGVEAALAALGVTTELNEWFETSPPLKPGRFAVTAWVNKNLAPGKSEFLSDTMYQRIRSAIDNTKNVRSHYDMKVGAKLGPNTLTVGSAITNPTAMVRCDSSAVQEPLVTGTHIGTAMAGNGVSLTRHTANAVVDSQLQPATVFVAGVTQSWAVLRVKMEAAA